MDSDNFVNSGIDVTKSIFMTAIIMIGAPVGIFIAALIIDHFPRRLFGSLLLIVIAIVGYFTRYRLRNGPFWFMD